MTERNETGFMAGTINRALSGSIDRRQFMERAIAGGMTAAAASALWAKEVKAQTPKRGGTFRVGVHDGNTGDSLDPGTTEAVYMIQLNHVFRSYLTEITNTNELGGDLATSWESSPDASEWRFELARGATFHSGKPFTARDAKASLDYHRAEASTSVAKPLLASIETIETEGDHTLVIKMDGGNADLPYTLSDYHLVMLPSDDEGNVDWQSGDGTGPYRIVNHEPGVGTELVRHDDYHKMDEGAWFDAVTMVASNEINAQQTALITGQFDAISQVDAKTISLLARDRNLVLDEVPSGAHATIPMFCDVAPFDNVDVRLALKHAINRQDIVEKILNGRGVPGNDHPIGPTLPYWSELPQREYDPDKARFHLRQAGMEGLEVNLSSSDAAFAGAVDMATLFREHAAAAGITINVVREPADGYWSDVWLVKPFTVVQWGARPTPDVMFSLAYKAGAEWNESHWENARFNELLLLAKAETDDAKRVEMYKEMMMLCRDDGGTIVPFFRNRVWARRSNVQHTGQLAGNWELDGCRAYQRWWFEDA